MVLIKRSTNPVALWSPTGLNLTFMLCSWQNSLTSLEIKPDPLSVLIVLGIPYRTMYLLRKFMIDFADVLDVI